MQYVKQSIQPATKGLYGPVALFYAVKLISVKQWHPDFQKKTHPFKEGPLIVKQSIIKSSYTILAWNVYKIREWLGLKMQDVYKKAGIFSSAYNYIETQRKPVSMRTITKLAKAFGVPEFILFTPKFKLEYIESDKKIKWTILKTESIDYEK